MMMFVLMVHRQCSCYKHAHSITQALQSPLDSSIPTAVVSAGAGMNGSGGGTGGSGGGSVASASRFGYPSAGDEDFEDDEYDGSAAVLSPRMSPHGDALLKRHKATRSVASLTESPLGSK